MARFADVGVALLDPFKASTVAKAGSTTVAARSPYASGQSFAGLGKQGTIFGKPKPPVVVPVIQVLPKPPLVVIPATGGGGPSVLPKPPISTLPTTVMKPAGTLSIVPAQGGGGGSAPAGDGASGADSPAATPPASGAGPSGGLLSNSVALGAFALLAYLMLKGGRR